MIKKLDQKVSHKGRPQWKKNVFFRPLSKLPLPPIRATCTTFFGRQKRRVNAYYDNDGSDNCDYNFVTFDDFGVKNDQKVYT